MCLGYDNYHVPQGSLTSWLCVVKRRAGPSPQRALFGSYVPLRFYKKEPRVRSVMIEIKRSTYMDELRGSRLPRFGEVQRLVGDLLRNAVETV